MSRLVCVPPQIHCTINLNLQTCARSNGNNGTAKKEVLLFRRVHTPCSCVVLSVLFQHLRIRNSRHQPCWTTTCWPNESGAEGGTETRIVIDTTGMIVTIAGIGAVIERIGIGRIVTGAAIDMIGIMNGPGEVAGGIEARVGIGEGGAGLRRAGIEIDRGIDLARGRTETGRGIGNDLSEICRLRLNRSCRI